MKWCAPQGSKITEWASIERLNVTDSMQANVDWMTLISVCI